MGTRGRAEIIGIEIRGSMGALTCDGKARQSRGARRRRMEMIEREDL